MAYPSAKRGSSTMSYFQGMLWKRSVCVPNDWYKGWHLPSLSGALDFLWVKHLLLPSPCGVMSTGLWLCLTPHSIWKWGRWGTCLSALGGRWVFLVLLEKIRLFLIQFIPHNISTCVLRARSRELLLEKTGAE